MRILDHCPTARQSELDRRACENFDRLTHTEQLAAVYGLSDEGLTDHAIAHATRWHVEQVRRALGERHKR